MVDNDVFVRQIAMAMFRKTTKSQVTDFLSADTKTTQFYMAMAKAAIESIRETHRMWRK